MRFSSPSRSPSRPPPRRSRGARSASRRRISPPDHPIRLNGFGSRRAESEGVYHRLHARALAVDDGTNGPAVLLTVDVLGVPADVYDELARRLAKAGVRKERPAVAATHTHTGPMLTGANPTLFGTPIPEEPQRNIDRYTPVFLDKLEAVALAALKDRKPATLSWGVGRVTFAMNRRTKGGPTDHDLPVLFVKDEKGTVRAVHVAYACHCVTLSHNQLGGDWAGYAAAAVEDDFPGAVGLVAIGGGADQNPTSGVTGDKLDVAAGQGRAVAAEVRRLSRTFLAPVAGPLTAKVTTLDLPLAERPVARAGPDGPPPQLARDRLATAAGVDDGAALPKLLAAVAPAEVAASDNAPTLRAAAAFAYGGPITFEPEFGNIGYWGGERDHVVWRVRPEKPAAFDLYLDYACADDSAGNRVAVDGLDPPVRGTVAGTGGWDKYRLVKLGTVKLPAGPGRVTGRPDGPARGAPLALRTLDLVPVGTRPKPAGGP